MMGAILRRIQKSNCTRPTDRPFWNRDTVGSKYWEYAYSTNMRIRSNNEYALRHLCLAHKEVSMVTCVTVVCLWAQFQPKMRPLEACDSSSKYLAPFPRQATLHRKRPNPSVDKNTFRKRHQRPGQHRRELYLNLLAGLRWRKKMNLRKKELRVRILFVCCPRPSSNRILTSSPSRNPYASSEQE